MKTSVMEVHAMLSVLSVDEVETRIGAVPGVESVTVNYAAGNATVRYDETRVEIADIKSAVRQRGHDPAPPSAEPDKATPQATPLAPALPKTSPAAVSAPTSAAPSPAPAASAPPSAAPNPAAAATVGAAKAQDDKAEPVEVSSKPALAEGNGKAKPPNATGKAEPVEAKGKFDLKKVGKIILYVALAIGALVIVKYKFFTPPKVVIAQVEKQDYAGEVAGTGTVNVDVLAAIAAKIPGRIERVLVNEGDFVRAGQVVAILEDTDIRQMLERSQARLEAVRAAAQSSRSTAQARRATKYQTERAWEREKHLVATGAVSQEEADQYEERDRTAASTVGAADADIGAAQAQIGAANAEVKLQQFNLSQTKIFTYVSGVVTDRPKRAGDAIVPGQTVLTVADPKVILVEAYIDQRFAGQIKIGQTATVILRGRGKEQIAGRVYRIRPQADPAAEEMTVEISFPLPPAELQIGQWADVYVTVSETKDALVVPKTAVVSMGEARFVLVADANHRARQVKVASVATSPRSQVMAVIGELKAGEWVVTEPMGIKSGQKVRTTLTPAAKAPMPAMKM